jgi:hypothetical protein
MECFKELVLERSEPLRELGDCWQRIGLVTAEFWETLEGTMDDKDPYDAGWICGRAFGEALALVRSKCAPAGVEAGKLELLQSFLANLKRGF